MATTPCPHCAADVPVPPGDAGECPACGRRLRFIEVPERTCDCGASVPLPPGRDAVTCPSCGDVSAADQRRGVRFVATCPRCRRRIDVAAEAREASCPHCGARLTLHDTV